MPDLGAGGARPLPRRCLGACDHAAGGHTILDPWEAGDILHLIEQHHTQNRADAGDGLPPVQGLGIVLLRRLDDRQFSLAAQPIIMVNQGKVDRNALLSCWRREPFRHAVPMALGGQFLPDAGSVS